MTRTFEWQFGGWLHGLPPHLAWSIVASAAILGLALVSTGTFISQTASQSHLRVAAPPEARVTAAGLYLTCYYFGGTAAGVVPGAFWALGKWPACVAFIVAMQVVALVIALVGWRRPKGGADADLVHAAGPHLAAAGD